MQEFYGVVTESFYIKKNPLGFSTSQLQYGRLSRLHYRRKQVQMFESTAMMIMHYNSNHCTNYISM